MKNLLKQIEDYQKSQIPDNYFLKVHGEIQPGAQVEIYWKGRKYPDVGYIFTLPNQAWDEGVVCVHVPQPDNSDGSDNAAEVHIHLPTLLTFKRVKKVVVLADAS